MLFISTMRVDVLGAGPGGLYLALLLKKAQPKAAISVYERNAEGETFGWGVVFSDETLSYLDDADEPTAKAIRSQFAHWTAVDTIFRGKKQRSEGHGFSGIERRELLSILSNRARELGVAVHYKTEQSAADFPADAIVVAADGVNSKTRLAHEEAFGPSLDQRKARYIWLGTQQTFDAFLFAFEHHDAGIFQAHAYRFSPNLSTFIVETSEAAYQGSGLAQKSEPEQNAFLEDLFKAHLGGHKLLRNKSTWLRFQTLKCKQWSHKNVVLLGDSAHTAHFSIGSGTKMAMEDAIVLAQKLASEPTRTDAFVAYEAERKPIVERTQAAALDSLTFFENTARYSHFDPWQFAFRLMTRSKRIGYENLEVRDAAYVTEVREEFAKVAQVEPPKAPHTPPMFTPYALRSMALANRVVVSPMCMYSAVDGQPSDTHLVHLGSRAVGGAGLLVTEMTCVSADGRITPGCAGMYEEAHVAGWKRIVDFVHASSEAKIALQIGHAGRKGSTQEPWKGMDIPLDEGNWPLLSASAIPYAQKNATPKAMTREDMNAVKSDFVRSAEMAEAAGFDMLELHCAHGYLLASFLSPLTNTRKDAYGGSSANRIRYPLEVFAAVRAVWPEHKPMSVRISATDWDDAGITEQDMLDISVALKAAGADILHISTGQTTPDGKPAFYGRMFQTPFADQIRNEVRVPTIAVGNITTADQVNTILAAGRADLVALARPHLRDPYFTFHAAEDAGYTDLRWPNMYGIVRPRRKP
jgi:anthraniloyl-CoA monooxygenase